MKERPILFSAPMVRALLAGRKTVTRRLVKPQPTGHHILSPAWGKSPDGFAFGKPHVWVENGPDYPDGPDDERRCPYGEPGDRLWVKETVRWNAYLKQGLFAADKKPSSIDAWPWQRPVLPSIHMPRRASRITLEIVDVRVERLHDITEDDIEDEGIELAPDGVSAYFEEAEGPGGQMPSLRDAWEHLWTEINGKSSWDANPWVWRVGFKRLEQEARYVA